MAVSRFSRRILTLVALGVGVPALLLAVLGVFLSGAGPSVALLARRDFPRLERLLRSLYDEAGCAVVVRTLRVQPSGVTLGAVAAAHGRTI